MALRTVLALLILLAVLLLVASVKPISQKRQDLFARIRKLSYTSSGPAAGATSSKLVKSDQKCPEKCICFDGNVRCMFLRIKNIPQIPKSAKTL
jgi:hypothetical protein